MRPSGAVRILTSLAIAALVFTTGCSDELGPDEWSAVPDTVKLYSLSRDGYQGLPAAFDLLTGRHGQRILVETPGASGNWDFALVEDNGRLMLMPAGVRRELQNGAGVGLLAGESFEGVTKVPGDRAMYQDSVSVPLESGRVYALRSRTFYYGSQPCSLYGKLSPITIDAAAGELSFEVVRNPNCNDRSMVPPEPKK